MAVIAVEEDPPPPPPKRWHKKRHSYTARVKADLVIYSIRHYRKMHPNGDVYETEVIHCSLERWSSMPQSDPRAGYCIGVYGPMVIAYRDEF